MVATVPVIVSACSSTNNGGNNQGGGSGGTTQTEKITPELNEKVSLGGSLKDIYDSTGTKKTNELIAEEIKANINSVFKNGEKLAAESDLKITVNGNFPETLSNWKDLPYLDSSETADNATADKSWSATASLNKVLYPTTSKQIDIKSLDDLYTKLDEATIKAALKEGGVTTTETSKSFTIKNRPGLTNDDLIHVNVEETKSDDTKVQHDLQIPTSDINLVVSDLTVKVEGQNIETTENTKTTTEFDFNIGIDTTTHYNQGSETSTAQTEDAVKVEQVLKDLKLATADGNNTKLDNEALIKALGVYNVTFSLDDAKITKDSVQSRAPVDTKYTVTLKATPNKDSNNTYVWDDGTSDAKDITFPVTIKIGS
ncbi:P35 family lipoprotein [Malacoplasma penetrans]|uniref:P35 family lipoprotein n=1 Tax=Malacoplasma penetrans TaxID=28227 RepID=UPI0022770C06|nr:P35 family lipoprotein [Malacoplasma penetrans]